MKRSSAIFLLLEFFILLPSLLFILGVLLSFMHYPTLFHIVISSSSLFQYVGITIISPLAGGFLAYQYLERYQPKGYIRLKAKGILAYSIIEIGLVAAYYLIRLVSR